MLENATGTKMINVPFKANGPALAEVMAGRVTFMFYPIVGIAEPGIGEEIESAGGRHAQAARGFSGDRSPC